MYQPKNVSPKYNLRPRVALPKPSDSISLQLTELNSRLSIASYNANEDSEASPYLDSPHYTSKSTNDWNNQSKISLTYTHTLSLSLSL